MKEKRSYESVVVSTLPLLWQAFETVKAVNNFRCQRIRSSRNAAASVNAKLQHLPVRQPGCLRSRIDKRSNPQFLQVSLDEVGKAKISRRSRNRKSFFGKARRVDGRLCGVNDSRAMMEVQLPHG